MYYRTFINLIVSEGEEIDLTFEHNDTVPKMFYRNAKVSGELGLNQTLFKYLAENPVDLSEHYRYMYTLDPYSFKKFHDSVASIEKRYADNFLDNNKVSEELKSWIQVNQYYNPAMRLLGYDINHRMFNSGKTEPLELPEEYYTELKYLPKLQPKYLINSDLSRSFTNYYTSYQERKIRKETGNKTNNIDSLLIQNFIDINKDNPLLAQLAVNEMLSHKFENNDLTYYNRNRALIEGLFEGSVFEPLHKTKIEAIEKLLANPVLPEKTEILTFKTQDPSKYLEEIITNAKGKVIYIDNWATWCGPCKSEFKYGTPELKEKFGDKLEYVYLCYQSKKELWKPTISQFKVEGKHYFIEKGKDTDLKAQIGLKGYPTYVLVNRMGEIVKSGFEYRPSADGTAELLTELISEEL